MHTSKKNISILWSYMLISVIRNKYYIQSDTYLSPKEFTTGHESLKIAATLINSLTTGTSITDSQHTHIDDSRHCTNSGQNKANTT